jgi:glycosyltransferase involved in cell wall biosynthesis
VYESLLSQTFTSFEWLIVDDGSADNTEQIVQGFIKTAAFPIRYIKKENGGKHIAINRALFEAKGLFFLCADSDDRFTGDALQVFHDTWFSIPENERVKFCGIRASVKDQHGNRVSDDYSAMEPFDSYYQEAFYKKRMRKETWWMLLTQLQKKFLFPEAFVSVLIPEGLVLRAINTEYKTRCVNKTTRIYYTDYDELSLMKSNKNPKKQAFTACVWASTVINDYRYFFYDIKLFTRAFFTFSVYWPAAMKKRGIFNLLTLVPQITMLLSLPFTIIPGYLFHSYKRRAM